MVERQIGERKQKIIEEESDVSLKSNLEEFGMKKIRGLHEDILRKDKDRKVKEFNESESTIIRRDDKRDVFVYKCKAFQSTASRHHVVYAYYCTIGGRHSSTVMPPVRSMSALECMINIQTLRWSRIKREREGKGKKNKFEIFLEIFWLFMEF